MSDELVIDFETKFSFAEVGGENNIEKLGISVAGVYSYAKNAYFAFEEHELTAFEDMLSRAGHLIGFNIIGFDLPVIRPYLKKVELGRLATTDIYLDATNFLGHRVGLNAVAKATLGEQKSGHGLEALEWFRQGRVEDVKKYCLDDVRLTKEIYEYGKKNGHILFESYVDGKSHSIPVAWGRGAKQPILKTVEEAFNNRRRLAIQYISAKDDDGLGFSKSRLIDIYKIKKNEVEAFCHLRKAVRVFRLNRILQAEPTPEAYTMPQDFQTTLF